MVTAEEQYLLDLAADAPQDHPIQEALHSQHRGSQRLSYVRDHAAGTSFPQVASITALLTQAKSDATLKQSAACVIENISPEYIAALGVAWNIPRDFFIHHAANPDGDQLWEAVMSGHARNRVLEQSSSQVDLVLPQQTSTSYDHYHIEGVLSHIVKPGHSRFRRRLHHDPHSGWQTSTKISYCRISKSFCRCHYSCYGRSLTSQILFW